MKNHMNVTNDTAYLNILSGGSNSLLCPCSFFVIYVHFECMISSVKNAFKNTLGLKAVQMWQLQIIFHTHRYDQMVLILFFSFCFFNYYFIRRIWNSIGDDVDGQTCINYLNQNKKLCFLVGISNFTENFSNLKVSWFLSVQNAFKNTLWWKAIQMWQLQMIFHIHTYDQMVLILFFSFCFFIYYSTRRIWNSIFDDIDGHKCINYLNQLKNYVS